MYNRVIGFVLGGGAVVFVLLLAGVGASWVSDDPPAVNPYSSGPGSGGEPQLVLTAVAFGEDGYVEVTNVGTAAGSLEGHWICQFPAYFRAGGQLAPGESVRFDRADSGFGSLNADSGEIGLYTSNSFGDPKSIIAYVEWGETGHARSGVAAEAGVWAEALAVDTQGASMIVATEDQPTSAGGWAAA